MASASCPTDWRNFRIAASADGVLVCVSGVRVAPQAAQGPNETSWMMVWDTDTGQLFHRVEENHTYQVGERAVTCSVVFAPPLSIADELSA